MPLISAGERGQLEALSRLTYCNPFLSERIELERRILGDDFRPFFPIWHPQAGMEDDNPNVLRIAAWAEATVAELRARIAAGRTPRGDERRLYQDACVYALYYRYQPRILAMIKGPPGDDRRRGAPFYADYRADVQELLDLPGVGLPEGQTPEHLFACFFQVRRAFHYTFRSIAGSSMPAARLRAQVWQSIFTHDLRRYQRALYRRMGDVTTLITGPSGVGKELVARAIGHSRYIPFDTRSLAFKESYEESFFSLNLPALSPTLIESELFGHRRGAFTGAVADREGWLEVCPPFGTVLLDEIGEVDQGVQVKLLRAIESRRFQRLGTTEERVFRGKFLAATNRDLALEVAEGRFREDLYYRLCADTIAAPSLRERISDSPEELSAILLFLAQRLLGTESGGTAIDDAAEVAKEAEAWIHDHLGEGYPWPGNVRELSQCLSNILIHRDYRPLDRKPGSRREALAARFLAGESSADAILRSYCTLVYERTGSYVKAAETLGIDRRTVKSHIDAGLLDDLAGG